MKLYLFVFDLYDFFVSVLDRLMASHFLYELKRFLVDFGVEFKLSILLFLFLQFLLLYLFLLFLLIELETTEQDLIKLIEGFCCEVGLGKP